MSTSYSPKIVTDGLVLALDAANIKSYSGSGTTWTDLSGNNNTGTLTNGPTFNGENGGSIVFDGTNDCVVVNSNANILSKTTYTKIAWFYTTSFGPSNNIIAGGNSGQHTVWLGGTTTLRAGHNGVWDRVISTTILSVNTWYFGAVTFNSSTGWVLYLNGVREATNVNTTQFTGNQEILIGAYGTGTNVFIGRIPIAVVYNRTLSANEVLQNYNATRGRFGV